MESIKTLKQQEEQSEGLTLLLQKYYKDVFCSSVAGKNVLYDILATNGYFAQEPDKIDPKLMAMNNRILRMCGIISSKNMANYMDNLIKVK